MLYDDLIRTVDLWCRQRLLCQLCHNHCPKQVIILVRGQFHLKSCLGRAFQCLGSRRCFDWLLAQLCVAFFRLWRSVKKPSAQLQRKALSGLSSKKCYVFDETGFSQFLPWRDDRRWWSVLNRIAFNLFIYYQANWVRFGVNWFCQ